jgi:hypothetical protein
MLFKERRLEIAGEKYGGFKPPLLDEESHYGI